MSSPFQFGVGSNVVGAPQSGTSMRILREWMVPAEGVREADGTAQEMAVLFERLPPELSQHLQHHFGERLKELNEIYLQLGQLPECIFEDNTSGKKKRELLSQEPCSQGHIDLFADFFLSQQDSAETTKRKGISGTLHRVSLITHPLYRPEKVLGVAVRVGRALQGLLDTMTWGKQFWVDMAQKHQPLLLIGKPGVGKTTVLREIASTLASDTSLNVVVIDKTCEIAGDGVTPHPAIGRSRWMPVGVANLQHVIMREAVENQSPDVIIVDEISTPLEVQAARTISQRGVQLIATIHGVTLPEIILDKERGSLVGGVTSVTLSGQEAERRADKRKQVQKRNTEPVFTAALELRSRSSWIYHSNVKDAADSYFENERFNAVELCPGKAIDVKVIPMEGHFDYCRACVGGVPCGLHKNTAVPHHNAAFQEATNNHHHHQAPRRRKAGRGR